MLRSVSKLNKELIYLKCCKTFILNLQCCKEKLENYRVTIFSHNVCFKLNNKI